MKLIVGLGNPGDKYQNNRHNVGFMFVDYMVKLLNCSIAEKKDKYSQSEICKTIIDNQEIILAKPQTFMNLSGQAVKSLTTNYQLPTINLIVIHDDLDIPLGLFRIDMSRGPKLHNGITSIEQTLKTKDFWRVRIGIDNRQGLIGKAGRSIVPGEAYVLQDFKEEEKKIITDVFPKIFDELKNKIIVIARE